MAYKKQISLGEGLIRSYPSAFVANKLQQRYRTIASLSIDSEDKTTIYMSFLFNSKEDLFEKLGLPVHEIDSYGYFAAGFSLYTSRGGFVDFWPEQSGLNTMKNNQQGELVVQLEPKFDKPIKTPDVVFHITKAESVNKILTQGLVPKSRMRQAFHPERIYVMFNKQGATELAKMLNLTSGENHQLTLLKINLKGTTLKFYKDPQYSNGAYTLENISPSLITIEEEKL